MTWGLWGYDLTAFRTAMYHEDGDDGHGHLDGKWQPGDTAHFEYHCWQSPDSADYDLWRQTQQPVKVLGLGDCDDVSDEAPTYRERGEDWGMPLGYDVQFANGKTGYATEDELFTHPKHYSPEQDFHPRNRQDGKPGTPMPGHGNDNPIAWSEDRRTWGEHTASRTAMPTWYHLTNDPDFALDPDHEPINLNDTGDSSGSGALGAGVFLTQRPQEWATMPPPEDGEWSGDRPYVAEIDAPDDLHKLPGVWHDPDSTRPSDPFPGADEIFVPDHQFHHLTVKNVHPRKANLMTAAVTVYTQPNCVQCTMTKKQLDKLGVAHDTVDVTADPEAHAYVSGLGYQSAPVVVVNDGEDHWSGYRDEKIKELAERMKRG